MARTRDEANTPGDSVVTLWDVAVVKSEVSELARMLIVFSLDLRDLFGHSGV